MYTPPPPASKTTAAQLNKLELEIELLRKEKRWYWVKLPLITTSITAFVASLGLYVTVLQFQKTELARIEERRASIENETRERAAKLQSEIQADVKQLTDFETDEKITPVQAGFRLEHLATLLRQTTEREAEDQTIANYLRRIVWSLGFDKKRHFDFDVSALNGWASHRKHWQTYPQSHHDFLISKYYPKVEELRSCFERISVEGNTINYRDMAESCDEQLIGAIIYGLGEHMRVAKENSESALATEIDQLAQSSGKRSLADELKKLWLKPQ